MSEKKFTFTPSKTPLKFYFKCKQKTIYAVDLTRKDIIESD